MSTSSPLPPLRWFIFKHPRHGASCLGALSRTEAEAVAEVQARLQCGGRRKAWPPSKATQVPIPADAPLLIRDTEAEDRANAILFGHATPRA